VQEGNRHLITLLALLFVLGLAGTGHANSTITTPNICPATLTQGGAGVGYSYTFAGTGGSTWSVISGSLPPGLTLTAGGVLSGTPSTPGTYSFRVRLLATTGTSASCSCTLVIAGCAFVGGVNNGVISFGSINPSSTSTLYGTVTQQVSFTCLSGTAYTIAVNPSSGWAMVSGSNSIPYTLGTVSGATYSGAAVNLFVPSGTGASSITPANYQNAPAGTYSNTSAVSIAVGYGTGTLTASVLAGGVSGTVTSTCAVSQSPGTLTFSINPSVSGTVSGTIPRDMQIKCTKNNTFSISAASSCGGLSKTYPPTCGGAIIPYTFSYSPGYTSGQGFGIAIPMNIGGSVSSANYQDAPVGSYGDLQTLTITY
jgi:large repetitive protein